MLKPSFCQACPINHVTGTAYVPAILPAGASELWVGEAPGEHEAQQGLPFVGGAGGWLDSLLRSAKISREGIGIVNTIGCRPPENIYPTDRKWTHTDRSDARVAIAYCKQHHLQPAIDARLWDRIVAMGDAALEATTNRKGILIWRGSPLPLRGDTESRVRVVPTFHPAYIMRNADMFKVARKDLLRNLTLPPENYVLYPTLEEVEKFDAKEFAFDFEWDMRTGEITMCGLTDRLFSAIVVPWKHPYISVLRRIFEQADVLIGHNIIGADTKYFEALGWEVKAKLVDTMLMHHLLEPNYRHALGFVASTYSNKVFWKGHGKESEDEDGNLTDIKAQWKTWDTSEAIPRRLGGYGGCVSADESFRLYNARDTDAEFQIDIPLRQKLKQYELESLYWNVSVPLAFICRELGDHGIKIDHTKLKTVREDLDAEIKRLDGGLPEGLKSYETDVACNIKAPEGTFRFSCKGTKKFPHDEFKVDLSMSDLPQAPCTICSKLLKGKPVKTQKGVRRDLVTPWNSSPQVLAYASALGCEVKVNRKTGNVTADKNARKSWGRHHPEFVIVDQLKQRVTLRNSFAKDGLLSTERVYFNLLVHGTSEGRLSSSGRRDGIDPNIQNQPKAVRKIYIADYPDWGILNPDFVQGENMITAWLAQDMERWERLHTKGYNEHLDFAARLFGTFEGGKDSPLYTAAKRVNHGRNYGMGVRKQQEVLAAEGFNYTEPDIKEFIAIWKKMNAGTANWQNAVIAEAGQRSCLTNVFGRKRWFQSRDYATKSLAFLPASTLADICHRCMIGLYPNRFTNELNELGVVNRYQMPEPWRLMCQVHDSLPAQGPRENYMEVAYGMKHVMTQPWRELNGFALEVDFGWSDGKSWGELKTVEVN